MALELPPEKKGVFLSKEVAQASGLQDKEMGHMLSPETAHFSHQVPVRGGWAVPGTYFPNAVFAEVFIVAENDDFVGHGCTDAQPVLNLKGNREKRKKSITAVYTDSLVKLGKEHQLRAGSLSLGTTDPLDQTTACGKGLFCALQE